jgi:hypothetical protein
VVVFVLPAIPAITGDHLRQPEIDDPQHLLQLIMDNKIEVVANDTADRVVALSDTWNAEVNSLFLPFQLFSVLCLLSFEREAVFLSQHLHLSVNDVTDVI